MPWGAVRGRGAQCRVSRVKRPRQRRNGPTAPVERTPDDAARCRLLDAHRRPRRQRAPGACARGRDGLRRCARTSRCARGPPWRWVAPRACCPAATTPSPDFAPMLDAPPSLAIGCGRQAALATRLLRERGARAVQILDPRIAAAHWDLVVAPEHDRAARRQRGHAASAACIRSTTLWLAAGAQPILDPRRACRRRAPRCCWAARASTCATTRAAFDALTCNARPRAFATTAAACSRPRRDARRRTGREACARTARDMPGLRWFAPSTASDDDATIPIPACSRGPTASSAPPIR